MRRRRYYVAITVKKDEGSFTELTRGFAVPGEKDARLIASLNREIAELKYGKSNVKSVKLIDLTALRAGR